MQFLVAELRLDVNLGVAGGDVFDEQVPVLVGKIREHRSADCASRDATQSRVQHHRSNLPFGNGGDAVDRLARPLMRELMPLRVTNQDLRKRAGLHRTTFEARGFNPGVFSVVLKASVKGIGFAPPGMQGLVAFVPGVGNVFGDAIEEAFVGVSHEVAHLAYLRRTGFPTERGQTGFGKIHVRKNQALRAADFKFAIDAIFEVLPGCS